MSPPTDPARILLVEDDAEIARMLADLLEDHGFAAVIAGSGSVADTALARGRFDLVLLDVMLPGEDGLAICRRLRARSRIPIIMVTALGEDIDRVLGLEIGADDYVSKPFNARELLARVRALLRRATYAEPGTPPTTALRFGGWEIDARARRLTDPEGVEVAMTSAEFDILLAFCHNPGRVLTRAELLSLTHGGAAGPVERSVDVHVSRVRQKIEPDPRDPTLIKTVRMGGYVFTAPVEAA